MDTIADMGGSQEFGTIDEREAPHDPPFKHEWEKRAFAMALLSMRIAGTNLDNFRFGLERLHPSDYLGDGYFGRWLNMAEDVFVDSNIIADGAVVARVRKMMGEDVEEPPPTEPKKPDYKMTAGGSIRQIDTPRKFAIGDRVRVTLLSPSGHTRKQWYLRGHVGTVRAFMPAQVFPDTNAHFIAENPQHVYHVEFDSEELWGPEAEKFTVTADMYEPYLEEVS